MLRTRVLAKNFDPVDKMIRNPTDMETDATEYEETEELYRRPRCSPIVGPLMPSGQIHQRSVRGESCARCSPSTIQGESRETTRRKRKPKNQIQHCPSCHCPPEILKTSPVRFRNSENVEALLERYEKYLAEPYPKANKSMNLQSPRLASHCCASQSGNNVKSVINSNHKSTRSHDHMLGALWNDLVSSGLTNEETQACCKHQGAPIKSVYKKKNTREDHQVPRGREVSEAELDSDCLSRYFRDFKNLKKQSSNTFLQRREHVQEPREKPQQQQQQDAVQQEMSEKEKDEEWRQFERDSRMLDELDHELREFEKQKERQREDEEDQHWEKHQKSRLNDEEQLKRKVIFLPSKLPVAMNSSIRPQCLDTSRSRSPKEQVKSSRGKMEASTSYHSVSNPDNNDDEEFSNNHFEYPKDVGSLDQELKDIPYCKPCRYPSAQNPHANKPEEEMTIVQSQVLNKPDNQGVVGTMKKNTYAGGDLDLHASKSYIVDLIDRALSRELGTIPEERQEETRQGPTQQEICVEITRALQGDCCQSFINNFNSQQETPDYVRQLKVLRWEYLNHIQDELRKLQDLERFLDTCSPRQSLPILHSQSSTTEQKKEHQTVL